MTVPSTAPVLSTPDDHIFNSPEATSIPEPSPHSTLSDNEFNCMFDIPSTIAQIVEKDYQRIALQFPDELLCDSERVYSLIVAGINTDDSLPEKKVCILADTSYAACCVDEIAAEHASADVLVHYGRTCLSPTSRLPVIYVFTTRPLDLEKAVEGFEKTFPSKDAQVMIVADITYSAHTSPLHTALSAKGYTNVFPTDIIHSPSSLVPNRTLPPTITTVKHMQDWSIFHISPPLPSLQLILSSRVKSLHYFDPEKSTTDSSFSSPMLRRRYAVVSHAKSAGIIGILVNTLNIQHYLPMITHLKSQIRAAGRKSYLVVVGKVNIEKVSNFAEIEVWVGIGCWEQGVVGGTENRGWYRPVITPWELSIALGEREWTGGWISDFAEVLKLDGGEKAKPEKAEEEEEEDVVEEGEDAPPEYDLRTGRYISTSRPLEVRGTMEKEETTEKVEGSSALTTTSRQKELALTGGVISPAADFLKNQRTWQGLGSDFVNEDTESGDRSGAIVEEGRAGVARGYQVGDEGPVH